MKNYYLITGGGGFIGSNLANHYLSQGRHVTIFDNFSRSGAEHNVEWLRQRHGDRVMVIRGDVRDPDKPFQAAVENREVLFHSGGTSR